MSAPVRIWAEVSASDPGKAGPVFVRPDRDGPEMAADGPQDGQNRRG